jgi:hypothetical protein
VATRVQALPGRSVAYGGVPGPMTAARRKQLALEILSNRCEVCAKRPMTWGGHAEAEAVDEDGLYFYDVYLRTCDQCKGINFVPLGVGDY